MPTITHIPYKETGFFSKFIIDYLSDKAEIRSLYHYRPTKDGVQKAITERTSINRQLLVDVLKKQYHNLLDNTLAIQQIEQLAQSNTFTICTAHQPNLATGYLYFIYKILHAIKLATDLNEQYPDKHFVPVYYMGSEDNDLDELGTFNYNGKKYSWDANGQTGAVGRMNTASLELVFKELWRVFGPPGDNLINLQNILNEAYIKHKTISEATQFLVHTLFGQYGLVVLNPDDAALKRTFIPVMEDDLLQHTALGLVTQTNTDLQNLGYKTQAYPRQINLFYMHEDMRERIEYNGENWYVNGTNISWNKTKLLAELNTHPERFSPNVILRGLYQETILPNIAFIGGGAEVAYWMQLKQAFAHYNVFFPVIMLRQSALWIPRKSSDLRKKLNLSIEDIFLSDNALLNKIIDPSNLQLNEEKGLLEVLFETIKAKATSTDATLTASAEAVLTKIRYQLAVLEKKIIRAEKRKLSTYLTQVDKLKSYIFPKGNLQERHDNFMDFYLLYGNTFFSTLYNSIDPLRNDFLVIEE